MKSKNARPRQTDGAEVRASAPFPARPGQPAPPAAERFTLVQAFDYDEIEDGAKDPSCSFRNVERCIRSVAFLLHMSSTFGNDDVDGMLAEGLARALEKGAADLVHAKHHLARSAGR